MPDIRDGHSLNFEKELFQLGAKILPGFIITFYVSFIFHLEVTLKPTGHKHLSHAAPTFPKDIISEF